jgi:hypothetical protein
VNKILFWKTTLQIRNNYLIKAIETKSQAHYHLGNDLEKQVVVAKYFNPTGAGT